MALDTTTIPQADLIWDVARVADAIHEGACTPQEIGAYIGAKGPRQGLYYAQAARVLGLVTEDVLRGQVTLTARGQAFVQYDRASRRRALRHLVLQREPTRSIIGALVSSGGLTIESLTRVVQSLAPLSPSTAQRRARTVAAWLRDLGLASWRADGRLVYHGPTMPSASV